jgi:hypothetical protein
MKTIRRTAVATRLVTLFSAAVMGAVCGFCEVEAAASIRFLPVNMQLAERKIGLQDSKGITELKELNPKKRSKTYTFSAGETPPSVVALDRQRPMGKPSGVDIILTAEMKSPLVLILEDPDHASGLMLIVMEDGEQGFPWGALRFVNTADKPLMIRCGEETKPIPESFGTLDINPGGEARNLGVQLFSDKEPDAILYSAVWEHDPNLRKLIFIMAAGDPSSKDLSLEIIPQDKRAKD